MNNTSPLKVRPAGELLEAEGPTQRFVLEPILARDTAGLIYGAPGVGKSFLALGLALAAAGGGSFLGWTAPRPRNVLYLDGEMSREAVSRRLRLFGPPLPSLHLWLSSDETGRKLDLSGVDGLLRLANVARDMDLV